MFNIRQFCLVSTIGLLAGCASGPELASYPLSQIERPYTLPKGVATWQTWMPFGTYSDDSGSTASLPIPAPIFWQTALSDNWTLNWLGLPISVSHQFSYSKDQVLGTTFGIGFGWATSVGWAFGPNLSLYHRIRLGKNWALVTTPAANFGIHTNGASTEYSVGLSAGPMFQLTQDLAITPKVGLFAENGSRNTLFFGDVSLRQPDKSSQITVPLSVNASWNIDRQWSFDLTYGFYRIGYSNNYTAHVGHLKLIHYW